MVEIHHATQAAQLKPYSYMYLDPSKVIPLESLIGQVVAITAAQTRVNAIATGAPLAPFAMLDAPGMGKTALIKAMVAEMMNATAHLPRHQRVQGIYINLKGTHNKTDPLASDFFEAIETCLCGGGERLVVILDELGTEEAKGSFQAELAAILSKIGGESRGGETIPLYGRETATATFRPERLSFVICTWHPRKIASDLRTRFPQPREFQLVPYTPAELAAILDMQRELFGESHTKPGDGEPVGITFTPYALFAIARSLRGNAREVEPILKVAAANTMSAYHLGEKYSVNKYNVPDLMRAVGVYPQGLSSLEVNILRALEGAKNGQGLRELEGRTGEAPKMITAALLYLQYQLSGEGSPFAIINEEGETLTYADGPQAGKPMSGPLIYIKGARYYLSYHGGMMLAILRKNKFIH